LFFSTNIRLWPTIQNFISQYLILYLTLLALKSVVFNFEKWNFWIIVQNRIFGIDRLFKNWLFLEKIADFTDCSFPSLIRTISGVWKPSFRIVFRINKNYMFHFLIHLINIDIDI
jgi:hypothetical protein